jgi:peptidoglycan/LPS O-acetylase OafA/YrhL
MGARFIPLFGRHFRKTNNLDFLRFFFATIVIYCHCYILYYGTEDTVEPLWVLSNGQMSIGTFAVNFFFILSGFLIYQSWENSATAGSFLMKRFLRIYPGFIVASLLCLLVIGPFGTADFYTPFGYWTEYYQRIDWLKALTNLALLREVEVPWSFNNLPIANVVNGSLWTIRYEFYCYLLILLFGSLKLFRFRWFNLGVFLVGWILYAMQEFFEVYLYNWQELGIFGKPDFLPRFIVYFFSGILFLSVPSAYPTDPVFILPEHFHLFPEYVVIRRPHVYSPGFWILCRVLSGLFDALPIVQMVEGRRFFLRYLSVCLAGSANADFVV